MTNVTRKIVQIALGPVEDNGVYTLYAIDDHGALWQLYRPDTACPEWSRLPDLPNKGEQT